MWGASGTCISSDKFDLYFSICSRVSQLPDLSKILAEISFTDVEYPVRSNLNKVLGL